MPEPVLETPLTPKPNPLTIVTPFSKALALILFIALPFIGFYLGTKYQSLMSSSTQLSVTNPSPEVSQPESSPPAAATSTKTEVEPSRASFPITVTQWKRYQNDKYGFSFNYPTNWAVKSEVSEVLPDTLNFTFQTDMKDENGKPRFGGFTIAVYQNPQNLALEKWIRQYFGDKENSLQLAKPSMSVGNALEALKIIDDKAYLQRHSDRNWLDFPPSYYIRSQSSVFVFIWFWQNYTYNMQTLEPQILPSFVFSK